MANQVQASAFTAVDIADYAAAPSIFRAGGVDVDAILAAANDVGGLRTSIEIEAEQRRRLLIRPFISIFTVLTYMIPFTLSLATLKYQANKMDVFVLNPLPTWCLLIATPIFYSILAALTANFPRLNNGIWFDALVRIGIVCGFTSVMCSISIFIARTYSFVPLVPVLPVAAALAWPTLKSSYNWTVDLVYNTTFDDIRARVANSRGAEVSSLPV